MQMAAAVQVLFAVAPAVLLVAAVAVDSNMVQHICVADLSSGSLGCKTLK